MWQLLAALGTLLSPVTTLWRTVVGDRAAKDAQMHAEQQAALTAYAMEWSHPTRTWWDALVDGLNRLVRPGMTVGVIFVVFVAPWLDPERFAVYAQSLALVPSPLWDLLWAVAAFWFGSRVIEKAVGRGIEAPPIEKAAKVATLARRLAERDGPERESWAVRRLRQLMGEKE